jgi:signal transduction histidine kinase
MNRLLRDLLELSRIGRLMNPPEKVPFESIVHDAMELTLGNFKDGKVKVTVQPDLPIVFGDRVRLVEVMQNLLDNAVKFMGSQPEPMVEIGTCTHEGQAIIFVRDNGIGIAPQFHERVFGLFNRLDQTVEGTGIGLTLVKRIIEIHGGRVWIESTGDGSGSTFYFTLAAPPAEC